jgi:hypothetical protein
VSTHLSPIFNNDLRHFPKQNIIVPYSQHNGIARIARNFIIKMNLFVRQITTRASSSEEIYYRPRESAIRTYALT